MAYPEDAHAPVIGNGKIHKLIAKIKLESVKLCNFAAEKASLLGLAPAGRSLVSTK